MKYKLLNGLDSDEQSEFKEDFIKAQRFRKRLVEVLNKEIESLQASMRDEDAFSSPNWAYIQADRVAQTKALKRVTGLLEQKID